MWNTFTAGLQLVQEKIDNVLDESQEEKTLEDTDGASAPPSDVTEVSHESSHVMITTQPPSPARVAQPVPPPVQKPAAEYLQEKVLSLQQDLDQSEQQIEIINSEYRKLLTQKEDEIRILKEQSSTRQEDPITPPSSDHTPTLEIIQKELAAHKEMVAELRDQLKEKEAEFQELNSKAETKFKKLRAQAKSKIADLNREVERLKEDKGGVANVSLDTSPLLNISSLDDSVSTGTFSPPASNVDHTHREAESLRAELVGKDEEIAGLKEEVCRRESQEDQLREEMATLKDKLNVSEVCLQKEQENRVAMELQMTNIEERLDHATSQLSHAGQEKQRLKDELEKEKQQNKSLNEELSHVGSRSPGSVNADLAGSEAPIAPSPSVLAAGERGSLLDMESAIISLESTVQEKDEQLSSFKAVLEEKEASLETHLHREAELSSRLQELQQETRSTQTSLGSEVEALKAELLLSQQSTHTAEERVKQLESSVSQLEDLRKALDQAMEEKDSRLTHLQGAIQETEAARENLEQELHRRSDEVKSLSESVERQKQVLEEKETAIAQNMSHVEALEQSVQEIHLSNESLRSNVHSNKEEAVEKMEEYSARIRELEQSMLTLQSEKDAAESAARKLEDNLALSEESLRQKGEEQREVEELRLSLTHQQNQNAQDIQKLRQEFQAAIDERDKARSDLAVRETSLTENIGITQQLKSEKEELAAQLSKSQVQAAKASGALEFAQEELGGKDSTIKGLSKALEDSKAALLQMESDTARLKSEQAEKLVEVMQHSEQNTQSRTAKEEELRAVRAQLDSKATELKRVCEQLEVAEREKSEVKNELDVTVSRLEVQDRAREDSMVECETLRGQVESLSKVHSSLSQEQTKQSESIAELTSKLNQKVSKVQSLQQKLQVAKTKLGQAVEEKEKEGERRAELEAELTRHQRENHQMKQQFESAVELMEAKVSEQSAAAARMGAEKTQKESEISQLKEQIATESRKSSEMKERVMKLSADCKVSLDRCRHLEAEKAQLQQSLSELTSQHSRLEHSFSDTVSDREALQLEHQTSLASVQDCEAKVMDLTNQLGTLAREKHVMDSQLREVSRQLLASEQTKHSTTAELQALREVVQSAGNWDTEKQAMMEERTSLLQEKAQLQAGEAELKSRLAVLEGSVETLQQNLSHSNTEMETLRGASSNPALKGGEQLSELQQTHAAELTRLQHAHLSELSTVQRALKEERGKREAAERALETQGEVAISMEDVQPFASLPGTASGENGPATLVNYINMASLWIQRLVKNPNIVLTRLLRATHQTKLLFLSYFIFLHLLLLYLIII